VLVATLRGHLSVVKLIFNKKGADLLGKVNKQRKNTLILAAMNGHQDIVEWIIKNNLFPVDL
jgi:ankyrin repeat protein